MASTLGQDQQQALAHVLNSPDQFTGMRGLAGTGKTTALSELSRALKEGGHSALFCAPTAAATDVLRKDGFPAVTLAKLLHDKELQAGMGRDSVIVLDEAGLVGTGEMMELFKVVGKSGARVVFSGDTGQHASVSRGDALRILEEHSRYSFRELSTIRRQQAEDYRHVVELAANHQPKTAFDRLVRLGWVHEQTALGSEPPLYEAAAAAYLESRSKGKSALLVAPTWTEIESVTDAVRKQLKRNGGLGSQEASVSIFDSLSWTDAQKRQTSQYSPGQRIVFGQDSGTFKQHEQIEVLSVDRKKNALQVRREDGSTHLFRPRTGTSFDVGEQRQIGVAPGDLLLLQANRAKEGLINGQVGTVKSVHASKEPKTGSSVTLVTLTDGRVLPPDYRQFSHGYCVTSHSAQARTVDAVMLVASSRSGAAIHQEQFYVSVSRGRQECQVFTDDKELLRNRVSRSTQRKAALELVAEALAEAGFSPPVVKPPKVAQKSPLHRADKLDATSRCPQRMIYQQINQQIAQEIGSSVSLAKPTLEVAPQAEKAHERPTLEIEPPQRRRRSRGISL